MKKKYILMKKKNRIDIKIHIHLVYKLCNKKLIILISSLKIFCFDLIRDENFFNDVNKF